IRLRENCRSASAEATFLPRIRPATRLSFCGLIRSIRAMALASLSARLRLCFSLLMTFQSSRPCSGPLGFLVAGVAVERAGRRKLTEFVAYHFLIHRDRNMLLPVVDTEGQADELRQDRRATAPDLDHIVTAGRASDIRLFQQRGLDERALPHRT